MLKLVLLIGLFALSLAAGGCGRPGAGSEIDRLSAKDVYTRLEQAMTRPGQVFHTTVRISQEAGLLSYQGRFELWAIPQQGQVRQISELTFEGGETSRQETVLANEMVYGLPVRGISPAGHKPLQCPEASVLASVAIACWRLDQAGETSVEAVQYEGVAAVVLTTEVAWSGSDETFDGTRRLYLDAKTFLPIVLHFDGTVDFGEVSAWRGRWAYENDFLPMDSLPDDFFDPTSIGYVEPGAETPLNRSGYGLTARWLGITFGWAVGLLVRLPS